MFISRFTPPPPPLHGFKLVLCLAGYRVDCLSVSLSEGHCTVGHIHSCSKIRLVGWKSPKEESQCLDPSCNHGVVTHLQCCLACCEGRQKTNSFVLCVPGYHLDLRFQKKPMRKGRWCTIMNWCSFSNSVKTGAWIPGQVIKTLVNKL